MTGKELLLHKLKNYVDAGELTKNEVFSVFEDPINIEKKVLQVPDKISLKLDLFGLFWFLISFFAIISLVSLIVLRWDEANLFGRILITFGFGIVSYVSSMLLFQRGKDRIGTLLQILAGILLPLGLLIAIDSSGLTYPIEWMFVGLFIIFSVLYGISYYLVRRNSLAVLGFLSVLGLIYSIVAIMFGELLSFKGYIIISGFIGLLLLILRYTKRNNNDLLSSAVAFVGVIMIYGSLFLFPSESVLVDIIFLVSLTAGLFVSLYFKMQSIFFVSILFLIVYIFHFVNLYLNSFLHEDLLPLFSTALLLIVSIAFSLKKYL